jgi:hypothetical protein
VPDLAFGTLVVAAFLAIITEGLLVVSTFRPRGQAPVEAEGGSVTAPRPSVTAELFWTMLPALFLALLFVAGLQTGGR